MLGSRLLRQAFVAVLAGAHATSAAINFDTLFGPYVSNGTEIANAADADFSSVLAPRWSTWRAPTFQGAVMPVTENDVIAIVKIAKKNKLSFLANNHGHGTNLHYGEKPLDFNINLANFNSVSLDAANNRLTVGGGARNEHVFPVLYAGGREMPTGNALCLGIVGVTIGGGVGTQLGIHGLMIDSLESVRIVTGTGDLVTASRTQNADLFWALRGAGANFGVIVSATYKVYKHTNNGQVVYNTYNFPPAANRSVFALLESYDKTLPAPMSLIPVISFNRTSNEPVIGLRLVYYGTVADAQPHVDKILALGPTATTSFYGPQPGMFNLLSAGVCNTFSYNSFTVGTKKTDPKTWEQVFSEMDTFYRANPGYYGTVLVQRSNTDLVTKTPSSDAVYPGREIATYALILNIFDPSSVSDATIQSMGDSVRSKLFASSGFGAEKRVYVNYDYGDEGLAAIYGKDNLARLRRVKARWDPQNLFGKGNPIV